MRSTVNIRGDLEKYVRQESLRSGMTIPNVIVNLAVSGMEYKEALKSFSVLATALQNIESEGLNGKKIDIRGD
uniref:Uncharacterized protein n=1 Tax=uncultured prokaryote TaxID=198431 RepID=A0A0H5Q1Q0_9ZZZZ|nr:hypothetical protein [uncultured prokaryote]